jgi:hypothetical protein
MEELLPKRWRLVFKDYYFMPQKLNTLERLVTLLYQNEYKLIAEYQVPKAEINKYEFKVCSQNGEDGILLYVFSKIGTTNRCFVEFGIGEGRECNTANLSLNFGWHGLLIDCNQDCIALAKLYYQNRLGIKSSKVKIIQNFVTAENINKILLDNGVEGEIDLLSIDIDGNDYWVWKAINVIKPRVVVIEYNASLGYEKSITVKYDPKFNAFKKHPSGFYHGASLTALTKLANSKGYILVGCDSNGVNAFFVRKDVAKGKLTEVSVQEAYFPNSHRLKSPKEQFECIKHLDFDYV